MVALADKLSNVRSTLRDLREHGDEVWARFKGGKDGTLWYYRAVAEATTPSTPELVALLGEYEAAIGQLERLAASPTESEGSEHC
jgi:hypothetical protein